MIRELFLEDLSLWSCLWQSTLFAAIGLVVSILIRRRPARASQIIFLGMITAVLVPAMSVVVKHFEWGLFTAQPITIAPESPMETEIVQPESPIVASGPELNIRPIEPPAAQNSTTSLKIPWRMIMLYTWLIATTALLCRLLASVINGFILLKRAKPATVRHIEQAADSAKTRFGITRKLQVRSSRDLCSPVIWCWSSIPILVVPEDVDDAVDWTGVISHELAHWRRLDHMTGLIAELAVCILPWNPLLWLAKKLMVRFSEQACDDWVVAAGESCEDYAQSLLNFKPQKEAAFVPAVVQSRKGVAARVRRILEYTSVNPRTGVVWALTASILMALIAIGIACAQTRPAKPADLMGQRQNEDRRSVEILGRSVPNRVTESDLDTEIADRFKIRFVKADYTASTSFSRTSQGRQERTTEHLRLRCEVSILDPNLALGISDRGTITHFENDQGKVVDVTGQTRPTRPLGRYDRLRYRSGPFVPSKPVRPAAVRLSQTNDLQRQWVDVLEPSQLTLELEPGLVGPESKKITNVHGYFYVLTAESLKYIEIPFEPNETWVRLTPDLEIKVLEAQSTESHYSYRIETRGERSFGALLQPGCDLPNSLPLSREFLDKDGKSLQDRVALSHMPLSLHIGGSGSGGGGGPRRVEKIRFAIAVNPSHLRIPFELEELFLPGRTIADRERPTLPETHAEVVRAPRSTFPQPPDGSVFGQTWVNLSWAPEVGAVSYDIYLGDNYDDVNNGTGAAFRGNQPGTFYVAGFPRQALPEGLVPGTTYYWRVDSSDGKDTHKGDVWSFTVKR